MGHTPVMVDAVVAMLNPHTPSVIVDGTLGGGGHTRAFLAAGATVWGFDRDPDAVDAARRAFAEYGGAFHGVHASYADFPEILAAEDARADAVFLDLGLSSLQLDDPERGFAFQTAGPLDMRFDTSGDAPMLVEKLADVDADTLEQVIREYSEERRARTIAKHIIGARDSGSLHTTADLVRAIVKGAGAGGRGKRLHPATRTFQALRVWVNEELDHLDVFLNVVWSALTPHGRVAILSYHSLEDRRVKHAFRAAHDMSRATIVTKTPVTPSDDEIADNPRARSAKLRVAERN